MTVDKEKFGPHSLPRNISSSVGGTISGKGYVVPVNLEKLGPHSLPRQTSSSVGGTFSGKVHVVTVD